MFLNGREVIILEKKLETRKEKRFPPHGKRKKLDDFDYLIEGKNVTIEMDNGSTLQGIVLTSRYYLKVYHQGKMILVNKSHIRTITVG